MVMLEALDRRCLEFDESSKAFLVLIAAKQFFERLAVSSSTFMKPRRECVSCITSPNDGAGSCWNKSFYWPQSNVSAFASKASGSAHGADARHVGLGPELDKRLLMVHFEDGCRKRIVQRRWLGRESVARDALQREHLLQRWTQSGRHCCSMRTPGHGYQASGVPRALQCFRETHSR